MFRLTSGKPATISKLSNSLLEHEIDLMERRAKRWARIFNTTQERYLTQRYYDLVTERLSR